MCNFPLTLYQLEGTVSPIIMQARSELGLSFKDIVFVLLDHMHVHVQAPAQAQVKVQIGQALRSCKQRFIMYGKQARATSLPPNSSCVHLSIYQHWDLMKHYIRSCNQVHWGRMNADDKLATIFVGRWH